MNKDKNRVVFNTKMNRTKNQELRQEMGKISGRSEPRNGFKLQYEIQKVTPIPKKTQLAEDQI